MSEVSKVSLLTDVPETEHPYIKRMADYSHINSISEIWSLAAEKFADITALCNPHAEEKVVISYTLLWEKIQLFSSGLQALGVNSGEFISLIADNSPRWLIADQGMMTTGAINAVRSAQADREELLFIIENSGSTALVVEDMQTFQKLRSGLEDLPIKFVVLLSDEAPQENDILKVINFSQLMDIGKNHTFEKPDYSKDALATLIYTSGTTGKPKGVMLSHGNLLHQVTNLLTIVQPKVGDIVLSILPTWHSYERSGEYFLLSQGCTQIYTNLRSVKRDLKEWKPNYMICVPRLLESIYEGVQKQFREQPAKKQRLIKTFLGLSEQYIQARRISQGLDLENIKPSISQKLTAQIKQSVLLPLHKLGDKLVYSQVRQATGGEIKQMISGGGALAKHIDNFFEIIGVEILVGYGLTETSPVTHARRHWYNLRGSSGKGIPGTETKIIDIETRQPLKQGEKGLVLLRGPQIMQGYYNNPEATAKAIDSEGWFNSGDLGWITAQNDLILTGRAKDTIVLTNGENIEPQPIEDACLRSPYIDQMMLVGQDQKFLGALIVPNIEALEQWAQINGQKLCLEDNNPSELDGQKINLSSKIIQDLFRQELNREVRNRPGYRPDDRIGQFRLIMEPFSIENGMMTQTLKIRRHIVVDNYHYIISEMFAG
ncbi:MAG: long-chain fatty acid--CoA ligase [Cyanobacteria bacterium P01_A01_bin.84]